MNALVPTASPRIAPPLGTCDCHMHAFGDPARYRPRPGSPFPPVAGGDIETYRAVRDKLGLTRAVVVQPSVYGFDNAATLDAMAMLGSDARGVAVVPPDVPDAELERLTSLGIRGIRFFMIGGGVLGWDDLEGLAARTASFGWHVQLQMDGRDLATVANRLLRLPGRLVIDHNGKFLEPVSTDHQGFRALLRLIEAGRTWVKTSGVYETSWTGAPAYADVAVLARALLAHAPERCLFGTNWPHPSVPGRPPDDAHLIDLFAEWAGDDRTIQQVMVDNPANVYCFEPLTLQATPSRADRRSSV